MLVTDYDVALEILRDQVKFPRDARRWQQGIPSDCPVLPIMAYRPTCNLTDDPLRSRLCEAGAPGMGGMVTRPPNAAPRDQPCTKRTVDHDSVALSLFIP
jgi:hypothetical protein